ncbi:hypothetical protein HanRHA438_Chr10g0444221 [Helianthus annuus]|nr:hypothetical protein HanIR_Chr16g0797581 [Helianthus annuus]KAJ0878820.1 hypothetical protein HanRHA438_Chr10g0444221 [Helianthus annuus]
MKFSFANGIELHVFCELDKYCHMWNLHLIILCFLCTPTTCLKHYKNYQLLQLV